MIWWKLWLYYLYVHICSFQEDLITKNGFFIRGWFTPGHQRSGTFWKVLHCWPSSVHSCLSRRCYPSLVGLCLRQLPAASRWWVMITNLHYIIWWGLPWGLRNDRSNENTCTIFCTNTRERAFTHTHTRWVRQHSNRIVFVCVKNSSFSAWKWKREQKRE